jgi:transcriptional regulator with XRE-family HTH domain
MDRDAETQRLAAPIGRAIAEARARRGWTQEELAEAASLTPGYIARLERGQRLPGPLVLDRLTRILGVNLADIWPQELTKKARRNPRALEAARAREAEVARLLRVLEPFTGPELRQITNALKKVLSVGRRMTTVLR